jgi:uroporphyrin-III C-methyltransferase
MEFPMSDIPLGKVYLVGAGPGDPELLTVKAQRLIERAAIVLHDALVPAAILAGAGPQAQIVNVGKRCGAKAITQTEINTRMVESAGRGLDVVRLHGGDPAIFGRLAEELDALEDAGIPFEIVPGVTAGAAAAAALGVSLTDRRRSSRAIIVSGHRASKSAPQDKTDWKDVAGDDATLVVYMPGKNLARLRDEFLDAGLSREIPAVLVSRATMPGQQHHSTTVGDLDKLLPMEAPAVLLVGRSLGRIRRRRELGDSAALAFDEVGLLQSL